MVKKIISGGQTGADQAALDAAMEMGVPHGGWIPRGRKTEKGPLAPGYRLREMPDGSYSKRTEQNVLKSDGTLIMSHGILTGGSELTRILARKHQKPCLHLNLSTLDQGRAVEKIKNWIILNHINTLNVAGPRESNDPEIYRDVNQILLRLLSN